MFEESPALAYYGTMTRTRSSHNLFRRFISFINLSEQPKPVALRPGESVAAAWTATGRYLRNAMSTYESTHPKPVRAKR